MPEDMATVIPRVDRDDAMIAELEREVVFLADVDATVAELVDRYRKQAAE